MKPQEEKVVEEKKFDFGTSTKEVQTGAASIEHAPVKRSAGRPRKSVTATVEETPVKRSVGRPRKSVVVTNEPVTEKRSVGRPRKSAVVTNEGETEVPKKRGRPRKSVTAESKIELDPKTEFINTCLKKAGKTALPEISELFKGREANHQMKISDIATFIDDPVDTVLSDLSKAWKARNTINLSTEVTLKGAQDVGIDILSAGKVFMSIEVAWIKGESVAQCWSGRHRLVFLALAYGLDAKIPVSTTNFEDINIAREAVIFANKARRTRALEKAEFRVLKATGGTLATKPDEWVEVYNKTVTKKSAVPDFAVYSVMDFHKYGTGLKFKIANDTTRTTGMTTVNNLKGFWKKALTWEQGTDVKEFEHDLKLSCEFLNEVVTHMEKNKDFNKNQHLGSRPLVAIGTYFKTLKDAGKDPLKSVKEIANTIVSLGDIGSQKSEKTYKQLVDKM